MASGRHCDFARPEADIPDPAHGLSARLDAGAADVVGRALHRLSDEGCCLRPGQHHTQPAHGLRWHCRRAAPVTPRGRAQRCVPALVCRARAGWLPVGAGLPVRRQAPHAALMHPDRRAPAAVLRRGRAGPTPRALSPRLPPGCGCTTASPLRLSGMDASLSGSIGGRVGQRAVRRAGRLISLGPPPGGPRTGAYPLRPGDMLCAPAPPPPPMPAPLLISTACLVTAGHPPRAGRRGGRLLQPQCCSLCALGSAPAGQPHRTGTGGPGPARRPHGLR